MATLLYVDDEEMIGRVVSRYFSRRGDRVCLARTLSEARAVLAVEHPDAILVDVWLGPESGAELVTWIAEHHPDLLPRVSFVTGDHVEDDAPGTACGRMTRPVIQKPFELTELAHFVDDAGTRAGT